MRVLSIIILVGILLPVFIGTQNSTISITDDITQSSVSLFEQGEKLFFDGELLLAIQYYQQAIEVNPNYVPALIKIAEAYFLLSEIEKAQMTLDHASNYSIESDRINILQARIHTVLGIFTEAETLYNTILMDDPNNIEGLLGLAELALARAEYSHAIQIYTRIIRIDPSNNDALLASGLLHDQQGNVEQAEDYLLQSLLHDSSNPAVYTYIARHYMERNLVDMALNYVNTALTIESDYIPAISILFEIGKRTQNYEIIDPYIINLASTNPDDDLAWYLHGIMSHKIQKADQSIKSLRRSLQIDQTSTIPRIVLEEITLDNMKPENPLRKELAQYRLRKGDEYTDLSMPRFALQEYRRVLQLDPFNKTGRLRFAELQLSRGLREKYLEQLLILNQAGYIDSNITEQIEAYKMLTSNNIINQWDLGPHFLYRKKVKLYVHITSLNYGAELNLATPFLEKYFTHLLQKNENIVAQSDSLLNNDLQIDMLDRSRSANASYLVKIEVLQRDNNIEITGNVYLTDSGNLLIRRQVVKNGHSSVANALIILADKILESIPLSGQIIMRRSDLAVINFGMIDGMKQGQELPIIRQNNIKSSIGESISNESNIVGTIILNKIDDWFSQGMLIPFGDVDQIDIGNKIIMNTNLNSKQEVFLSPIYDQLRSIK